MGNLAVKKVKQKKQGGHKIVGLSFILSVWALILSDWAFILSGWALILSGWALILSGWALILSGWAYIIVQTNKTYLSQVLTKMSYRTQNFNF